MVTNFDEEEEELDPQEFEDAYSTLDNKITVVGTERFNRAFSTIQQTLIRNRKSKIGSCISSNLETESGREFKLDFNDEIYDQSFRAAGIKNGYFEVKCP